MKTLRYIILLTAVLIFSCNIALSQEKKSADNETMEKFVNDLLQRMTLEEKIGQMSLFTSGWAVTGPVMSKDYRNFIREGKAGAIFNAYTVDYVRDLQKIAVEESRLHIPLIFGYDVIHGHRTIFPVPLAQASSWDLDAIEKSERIAATEATAEGIDWVYAPMVDIARDPRWGRVMEGAGEDTWLGSHIAAVRVKGFQGSDLSAANTVMACVKHFAAYGAPQAGRDYNTVDMSERSLFEWYLPPYKAAVDAGVGSVMSSFNEIAGVPSTSNRWLLTDLLRNKWGFNGFVVSDYTSVNELIKHGVAADSASAGELAVNAGLDMDMEGSVYADYMKGLVESGKVSVETVNESVKRILEAKYKLGLFDDPYRYCSKEREKNEIMTPEDHAFARKFASESVVLLKNSGNTLPVSKKIKTIAVIGPLADSKRDMLGGWSGAGEWEKCVTLLEGIRNKTGDMIKVLYAKGCEIEGSSEKGFSEAVRVANQADFVILALGESADMTGEAASRTDISVPGKQMSLAEKIFATGKPSAVVLFNGRPLTIEDLDKSAPAIVEAWFGGTEAGNALADILFGDVNPSAKITMTFPRNMGQVPVFYNTKNTGRPFDPSKQDDKFKSRYIDCPNTPLYPFGYGLSYTTFSYSGVKLGKSSYKRGENITASVNITNTGNFDGDEIAQLYVHDLVGDVTRPVKELRGFRKIHISRGETVTVTFELTDDDLAYYHQDMNYSYDPGAFELYIGPDSSTGNKADFRVLE